MMLWLPQGLLSKWERHPESKETPWGLIIPVLKLKRTPEDRRTRHKPPGARLCRRRCRAEPRRRARLNQHFHRLLSSAAGWPKGQKFKRDLEAFEIHRAGQAQPGSCFAAWVCWLRARGSRHKIPFCRGQTSLWLPLGIFRIETSPSHPSHSQVREA